MGRRRSGKRGKSAGDNWESQILQESELIRARKRADVFKVPTPGERVSVPRHVYGMVRNVNRRYFVARKGRKAWVDFAGTIWGTGRAVHFEAKSTTADTSFSFSSLTEFQRELLERQARAGAVVFLYVQRREQIRAARYVFPVEPGIVTGGGNEYPGIIAGVTGEDGLPYQSIKWDLARERGFRLGPQQDWFDKLTELELI